MSDKNLTRRRFLGTCAACGFLAGVPATALSKTEEKHRTLPNIPLKDLKLAAYWEPVPEKNMVRCTLCPNKCERKEHEVTACHTRINQGGKLYSMAYAKPCVLAYDPLTKNPLYHVSPGATAIGAATAGCNLKCKYCQNWDISQVGPEKTKNLDFTPAQFIEKAKQKGLKWITFSYTEPTVYYEFALETAMRAKKSGIRVAMSSAGFMLERPLRQLMQYVSAFSITLKGSTDEFYKDVCKANLDDVKKSINIIAKSRCWLEVVYLIVPGLNDDNRSFETAAKFVATLRQKNVPLHFLRFTPMYLLRNLPPTPTATMNRAYDIASKSGLKYVYVDISGHKACSTYCTKCKRPILQRASLKVIQNDLHQGKCKRCRTKLPGIFT